MYCVMKIRRLYGVHFFNILKKKAIIKMFKYSRFTLEQVHEKEKGNMKGVVRY